MSYMDLFNRKTKKQPTTQALNQYDTVTSALKRVSSINTMNSWDTMMNTYRKLNNSELRFAYDKCPFIYKGYNKKVRDLIYDWFMIDSPLDNTDVPETMETKGQEFIQTQEVQKTLQRALGDMFWQGNGYLEFVTAGNKDPEQPASGELRDIVYIDPTSICNFKLDEYGSVEYWMQKTKQGKIPIHKSRIQHFAFYTKGHNPFGYSPSEVAYELVGYEHNSTKSLSELVHLFSHPFPYFNTGDKSDKSVSDAFKILEQVAKGKSRVGFVGKKDMEFTLNNPSTFDPSPILNHFYVNFSAILEMPMMLLIGEQKGKLTGSEVEMNDYYKSIQALQNIHLTPFITRMFKLLFGDSWNYPIHWNPLFTDEKHDAEIKKLHAEYIWNLYEKGLVELHEARQLLREEDIDVPEGGDMDNPDFDEEQDAEYEQPGIPVFEVPDGEQAGAKSVAIRDPTTKELNLLARKRRKLGEDILKEQEGVK